MIRNWKEITDTSKHTILENFQTFEATNPTPEEIVSFIGVENAKLVQKRGSGKSISNPEDYIDFASYFVQTYDNNSAVKKAMQDNWGNNWPVIFQVAAQFADEAGHQFMQKTISLNKKQKKNADLLTSYIMGLQTKRSITLTSIQGMQDHIEIPATISDIARNSFHQEVAEAVQYVLSVGGGIIVRSDPENGEKQIVNGFRFQDKRIVSMRPAMLRKCMQQQPDGSVANFDEIEVYQTAPCIFAEQKIMDVLLAIDLQPEFSDHDGQYERIVHFVKQSVQDHTFDKIIATQFKNTGNNSFKRYLDWDDCKNPGSPDVTDNLIQKSAYAVDLAMLDPSDHYFLCGCDTDACILATAFRMFDEGYHFTVLAEQCFSSGGLHDQAIQIMRRNFGSAVK